MAKKKAFAYPVKVLTGEKIATQSQPSWTKARRAVIRACIVGEADGAELTHREPAKAIVCVKDAKGIYRAYIGEDKTNAASLTRDGETVMTGNPSLVKSAYNMLDYRLNKMQNQGVALEVIEG